MAEAQIVTLGCRFNAFESEVIRAEAAAAGVRDAVIVNTCAVTEEAVRQARQAVRRLRRDRPNARIIVTGCAAQLAPEVFAAMPEVDRVLGNREKLEGRRLADSRDRVLVSDIFASGDVTPRLLEGFEGRVRGFVQVQQGCDHRCTFCIVPFARGPSRSVQPERIVEQVRRLVEGGCREVVLTGVDLCSYGADLEERPRLGDLVARVLKDVPSLPRLRLSTLDPAAIDERLIGLLGDEPRLMPHLHLSVQAADDIVLKRMRRRHSRAELYSLVERVRRSRPDAVLGADLIAGFPTETEAMFANTVAAVEELQISSLHVFPFSTRPGTAAARMPQLPWPVRRARAVLLRQAGGRLRFAQYRKRIGSTAEVLVEEGSRARCPYYAPVDLDRQLPGGALVRVRITAAEPQVLRGTVLE
jgi:threonylcarbamoyladenosine tRNA methylthiotransferase MtaB